MRQVRLKNYEGSKIFVFQHGTMFQYWFARDSELFMQWGTHRPKWWRWVLPLFNRPLLDEDEIQSIADAYVDHAVRSIDHILDPTVEHCSHNVKIGGKDPALCAICSNKK